MILFEQLLTDRVLMPTANIFLALEVCLRLLIGIGVRVDTRSGAAALQMRCSKVQ